VATNTNTNPNTDTDELTMYVVPCGAAKLDHAAPAAELYTGAHFRYVLNAALELADGDRSRVRIISALHGLLELDTVVAPYDVKMGDRNSIAVWTVADQLDELHQHTDVHVVALTPNAYSDKLAAAVRGAGVPMSGVRLTQAFAGCRGIGEQRGRVAELVRAHRATQAQLDAEQLATCPECGRTFDLTDDDDAAEWNYGHDCEPVEPAAELLEFHWAGDDRRRVSAGCTASWHYVVSSPATTVEAHPITMGGKPTSLADAYWVVVRVPGTIVDGWLPSWDRGERDRTVGQPHEVRMQMYGYAVRKAVAEGSEHWTHTPAQVAS
jgi:hypothetical protein